MIVALNQAGVSVGIPERELKEIFCIGKLLGTIFQNPGKGVERSSSRSAEKVYIREESRKGS